MTNPTLLWLLPLLLSLFVVLMVVIGVIMCLRSRKRKPEKTVCTCPHGKAWKVKTKRFFKESIFMTTSSMDKKGQLYRCEENCLCNPQQCKICRIDSSVRQPQGQGILKSETKSSPSRHMRVSIATETVNGSPTQF